MRRVCGGSRRVNLGEPEGSCTARTPQWPGSGKTVGGSPGLGPQDGEGVWAQDRGPCTANHTSAMCLCLQTSRQGGLDEDDFVLGAGDTNVFHGDGGGVAGGD